MYYMCELNETYILVWCTLNEYKENKFLAPFDVSHAYACMQAQTQIYKIVAL